MKITTVSYNRTYPLYAYANEKIGMEASVEDGETPEQVLAELKERVHNFHEQNNPQLYQEQTPYPEVLSTIRYNAEEENSEQQPQTQEQKIAKLIHQATSLPELEQWKLLSNNPKYPQLKELYQQKLKELTND